MLTDHPPDPGSLGEKLSDCSVSALTTSTLHTHSLRELTPLSEKETSGSTTALDTGQSTKGAQLSTTNSDMTSNPIMFSGARYRRSESTVSLTSRDGPTSSSSCAQFRKYRKDILDSLVAGVLLSLILALGIMLTATAPATKKTTTTPTTTKTTTTPTTTKRTTTPGRRNKTIL